MACVVDVNVNEIHKPLRDSETKSPVAFPWPAFFIVSFGLVAVSRRDTTELGESDLLEIQSVPGNSLTLSYNFVSSRPLTFLGTFD